MSLSSLINCFMDNVWILYGEVTCHSLLRVKGPNNVDLSWKGLHVSCTNYLFFFCAS